MALPGLSLPGLGLPTLQTTPGTSFSGSTNVQRSAPREVDLAPQTEWRFEVNFQQTYTLRILSGHAELFGVELAPNQPYAFSGVKGAVLSWQGCRIEVEGEAESEYVGQETEYAVEWLNVHGMLESARGKATVSEGGPRVLVVGPDAVGKSSLVRSLSGWGAQMGWTPTVINGDGREGLLTPAGSLTAVTVGSPMAVEEGYGIAPISGPTVTPVKVPLVYHCPYASPLERADIYKALITRIALSVTNKLEENTLAKQSGLIIDTPGSLNDPKSNYDIIAHIVSEFNISLILTLGSERLYNDLNRRFGGNTADAIPVLRIAKPGGAVEKDAAFIKQLQNQQIRQYFFGTSKRLPEPTQPHHSLRRPQHLARQLRHPCRLHHRERQQQYLLRSDDDDTPYAPRASDADFERVTPSLEMLGRLVAIKFCAGTETDENVVRDSAVMGFVYVSEVDEGKKRVRFLSPHPQRWGNRAMVWGGAPGAVADLVG